MTPTSDMDMDPTFESGAFENPELDYRLRRTGARPLAFTGTELCSAMSYASGTPLWYEVNLYGTKQDSFVVDVRMFTKAENESDMHRAVEVHSLDALFDWLEEHDPIEDVEAEHMNLAGQGMNAAQVALRAADLRMKVDEARRQYRDIVGQILYDLDL